MFNQKQIALRVALKLDGTEDRYDQIWAIKQELIANGSELLATDRETIDDILDILFNEYGFKA